MAEADLDATIRQLAKHQTKTLTAAAKTRRAHYLAQAGKAKDKPGQVRAKALAQAALEQGLAAAKRLQVAADNAADSYARAMRKAAEDAAKAAEDSKPAKIEKPKAEKAPPSKQRKAKPAPKSAAKAKPSKKAAKAA